MSESSSPDQPTQPRSRSLRRRLSRPSSYGDASETGVESKVRMDEMLRQVGDTLLYTDDFGDSWEHGIALEEVRPVDPAAPGASVPEGEETAPPEDCGGVGGYEILVAALTDPTHPEHAELGEWFSDLSGIAAADFDPTFVNLADLERRVKLAVT